MHICYHFFFTRFSVLLWVVFSIVVTATLYDLLSRSSQRSNKKNRCFNHEISLSFSLMNNLEKILSSKAFDSGLDCINGLKVFSMFLIIMGHRIMFSVGSPLSNSDYVESVSIIHFFNQNNYCLLFFSSTVK